MTVATNYLGKREFHGALAKRSPYWAPSVVCVVCSRRYENSIEIGSDAICLHCWLLGWRAPHEVGI